MLSARVTHALVVLCVAASCSSNSSFERHFDGDAWRTGWEVTTSSTERWLPSAILAGATPIAWLADKDVSEDSISHHLFNSNTKYGDEITIGLAALPLLIGSIDELSADDGRFLTVSAESLGVTMASTYLLKYAVNRQRPNGQGQDSFPSGHTSLAFAGATLMQRTIADRAGENWGSAAYLLYLPATYVGVSRLEGSRHYLADVMFGAALGMFVTHFVYDAHYGDSSHEGLFGTPSRMAVRAFPAFDEEGVGIGVSVSF